MQGRVPLTSAADLAHYISHNLLLSTGPSEHLDLNDLMVTLLRMDTSHMHGQQHRLPAVLLVSCCVQAWLCICTALPPHSQPSVPKGSLCDCHEVLLRIPRVQLAQHRLQPDRLPLANMLLVIESGPATLYGQGSHGL